jgi:geranylgeranyl diphosphate synthase type I
MTLALPPTLHHSRELLEPALRRANGRLDDATRVVAAYHLGFCDADGEPTTRAGGKATRPALALLGAQAAGGSEQAALPAAVAVELVHNFSLVHDDLMDHDSVRRHRATVWAVWGPSTAILVGDAMLALAHQVLCEADGFTMRASRLLADATQRLIRGQVSDLDFERRSDVTVDECIAMAADKTGALLGCSAAIGAALIGADDDVLAALSLYGESVGLAFQLVDDVLGIWGDPQVVGKPVGSDLRAGKKSLPICYALASATPAGKELADLIGGDGPLTRNEILLAAALIETAGARDWATAEASRHLDRAEQALSAVDLVPSAAAELLELGRFVIARER